MQEIADSELPRSMAFDWTELTYLQLQAGNAAIYVFALAVVFVFLVLAAQYESWALPLAVILVVPMCLLCSIVGVRMGNLDVNIFTQIGFVVLVGLASKNAILIVEFAKQQQDQGKSRREAVLGGQPPAVAADFDDLLRVHPGRRAAGARARGRCRNAPCPGAGGLQWHARRYGVRLFLTPVFYYVIQALAGRSRTPIAPAIIHHMPTSLDLPSRCPEKSVCQIAGVSPTFTGALGEYSTTTGATRNASPIAVLSCPLPLHVWNKNPASVSGDRPSSPKHVRTKGLKLVSQSVSCLIFVAASRKTAK